MDVCIAFSISGHAGLRQFVRLDLLHRSYQKDLTDYPAPWSGSSILLVTGNGYISPALFWLARLPFSTTVGGRCGYWPCRFWLTASEPTSGLEHENVQSASVLSVASANVNLENRDAATLVRWLAEVKPDVLVLQEVSPEYARELDALHGYPFRHLVPRNDPFGIAVLSRFPIVQAQTVEDETGIEHIEALIDWNGKKIRLTAWHPMPPISQYDHTKRNLQLLALAKEAKASGQPAIVAGDLNATPWSIAFSNLDQAGLRRASGLTPTWPAVGRGWIGIPIDHVLVTSHWSVVEREVGPNLGSDHLPVIVRIALREE